MNKDKTILLEELIVNNKTQGYVMLKDILPLMDEESNEFEEILEKLAHENIEVIFDEDSNEYLGDSLLNNESGEFLDTKVEEINNYDNDASLLSNNETKDFDSTEHDDSKSNNQLSKYLKEIGQYELLTYQQEIELSSTIQRGLIAEAKLKELKKGNIKIDFNNEEIEQLEYDIENGIQARDFLIESNLRLVVYIAKKYLGRGVDMQDLIQDGNLGLIKAADKFDYTRGFRFSTYATYWIKQAITRAIADKARTIRIPVYMVDAINKLNVIKRKLVQELRREPTLEELAKKLKVNVEKVKEIQKYALDTISLETVIGDDEESTLGDFISDSELDNPLEYTIKEKFKEEMNSMLKTLSEKEEKVIRLRFGFGEGDKYTLEEIATIYGVTRERIRQIESKALNKLRKTARSKKVVYANNNI